MITMAVLAGLVAITAPCAFVSPVSAVIIGLIAGILVVFSVFFFDQTLRIDDPVGAISVHGVNGAWGCLCVGLFADGTYGDGWNGVPGTVVASGSQLAAQCTGVLTCFVFVFTVFYVFFKVVDKLMGNRVSAETELAGLDLPEMGALAYPEFGISPGSGSGWSA